MWRLDVVQHRLLRVVAEGDVLEIDVTLNGRQLDGLVGLQHGRRGVEETAQLDDRGRSLLEQVVLLHQQQHWPEESVEIEEEGDQGADGQLVMGNHHAADAQDGGLTEIADELSPGSVDGVDLGGVQIGVPVGADHVAVVQHVVALAVVGGDDAHPVEGLGQVGEHVRRSRRGPGRSPAPSACGTTTTSPSRPG